MTDPPNRLVVAILGGTGNLGYGLALRLVRAGHRVIVGSRSTERAVAAAAAGRAALAAAGGGSPDAAGGGSPDAAGGGSPAAGGVGGDDLTGSDNATAARQADLVVVAVPAAAQAETLAAIADHVDGKVVVDATVSLQPGDPTRVEMPSEGSAAARAQRLLPGARVVGAFHTLSGKLLAQLEHEIAGDVLMAGDDDEAKAAVATLIAPLGARAIDAGPLHQSATLERLTALIIGLNKRYRRRHIGLRFTGL